jgi:hypothetical protein
MSTFAFRMGVDVAPRRCHAGGNIVKLVEQSQRECNCLVWRRNGQVSATTLASGTDGGAYDERCGPSRHRDR